MKKRILSLCLALCTTLLLSSCSTDGNPIPEGMDTSAVLAAGEQIVIELNAGDYQSVYNRLRDDAKTQTGSSDAIQAHMESVLNKVGSFEKIEDTLVTGQTLKDTGERYATAVFYCEHEKNEALYRIAFSTDMELLGLQVTKQ